MSIHHLRGICHRRARVLDRNGRPAGRDERFRRARRGADGLRYQKRRRPYNRTYNNDVTVLGCVRIDQQEQPDGDHRRLFAASTSSASVIGVVVRKPVRDEVGEAEELLGVLLDMRPR